MSVPGAGELFQDQVLQMSAFRARPEVALLSARSHPLTIVDEEGEAYALLNREYAAGLVAVSKGVQAVIGTLRHVSLVLMGRSADLPPESCWLHALQPDEIGLMLQEITEALAKCQFEREGLAQLQDTLFEWRESGWMQQSREVQAAFREGKGDEGGPALPDVPPADNR